MVPEDLGVDSIRWPKKFGHHRTRVLSSSFNWNHLEGMLLKLFLADNRNIPFFLVILC